MATGAGEADEMGGSERGEMPIMRRLTWPIDGRAADRWKGEEEETKTYFWKLWQWNRRKRTTVRQTTLHVDLK